MAALTGDEVILIPTGSLEQHGPHLPLFTDTLIVSAVAREIERALPTQVLLVPTLWLGASGHHLKMAGTLSAGFPAYEGALAGVIESLLPHGFYRFYVLNGHGGNAEPNGVALRELKARYPSLTFCHSAYYMFAESEFAQIMEGPIKSIRHACEAETSLMMHLNPELVRTAMLRDDGLKAEPPVLGAIHHFDEITEEGSLGYASLATPEKGKLLFEACVEGATREIRTVAEGYRLIGPP